MGYFPSRQDCVGFVAFVGGFGLFLFKVEEIALFGVGTILFLISIFAIFYKELSQPHEYRSYYNLLFGGTAVFGMIFAYWYFHLRFGYWFFSLRSLFVGMFFALVAVHFVLAVFYDPIRKFLTFPL